MMEIYRNMIFGEMLPTIRIKIKMTTKRRNLSPDLVVRKNRVAIAALVQAHPALEAVARKSPRNEDPDPPILLPPTDPDPEARNALLVVDPVHGQATKSGQGHTTKRARRGHGVHHRVRAQVAVVGQADQDLGNGQERSASKHVLSLPYKNIDSVVYLFDIFGQL